MIKVCGMGDTSIMLQLAQLPIDMLGFIFYEKSPRYVVGRITPSDIAKLPKQIHRVGVFVNATVNEMIDRATEYGLDTLQLHGNESPEICKQLKNNNLSVIKTFNIEKDNDYKSYATVCDYFLFDTPTSSYGGAGRKFDWEKLNNYNGTTPFILSGGIGCDDAKLINSVRHNSLAGFDINSKFETSPGVKNIEAIKRFLSEAIASK